MNKQVATSREAELDTPPPSGTQLVITASYVGTSPLLFISATTPCDKTRQVEHTDKRFSSYIHTHCPRTRCILFLSWYFVCTVIGITLIVKPVPGTVASHHCNYCNQIRRLQIQFTLTYLTHVGPSVCTKGVSLGG